MNKIVGFALSLTAQNRGGFIKTKPSWVSSADNEDEARGIGIRMAKRSMPAEKGFYGWQVAVMEIREGMLKKGG